MTFCTRSEVFTPQPAHVTVDSGERRESSCTSYSWHNGVYGWRGESVSRIHCGKSLKYHQHTLQMPQLVALHNTIASMYMLCTKYGTSHFDHAKLLSLKPIKPWTDHQDFLGIVCYSPTFEEPFHELSIIQPRREWSQKSWFGCELLSTKESFQSEIIGNVI